MKPILVYKTYHPKFGSKLFGEQYFLHSLIKDLVEEKDDFNDVGGAIISLRACDNIEYIDQFNKDISKLKWCLIIITGNENSSDFHKMIKHPNCKIWIQTPKESDVADYFLGFGYPSEIIKNKEEERIYKYSFIGQVNTRSRIDCVKELQKYEFNKYILINKGFNNGICYKKYLGILNKTKFALCPRAIATPDSFRIYEALEMGCVPILDEDTKLYFNRVWSDNPFYISDQWKDLDSVFVNTYIDFNNEQNICKKWWNKKKEQIVIDLFNQIESIQ
jgi:hypothetical protein